MPLSQPGGTGGTVSTAGLAQDTSIQALAKDATVAKDASLTTINTTLGAVAKDSTVAKDSSLTTINTSLGAVAKDASIQQVTTNGTLGALNANLAITVGRRGTLTMHTTGTWSGTISLQASLDGGTTWVTINQAATWTRQSTGAYTATITANDIYQSSVLGYTSVRVAMTAYTSGTANIYLVASDESAMLALDTPLPPGAATIGAVNVTGNGGVVSTKAASTAPAAADLAMVVTQSPNYVAASTGQQVALTASTNSTVSKGSAGSLFQADISNYTGSAFYLKLYNATTITVGTTVPVQTWLIATGGTTTIEFGQYGKRLGNGICWATTANVADTDATAIVVTSGPAKLGVTYL